MSFVQPFRDYIDSLVHPCARQDPLTATRHRAFIAPRLLGSLVALAVMPVYLVMRGAPSALEIAVFAWLLVPMLTAFFLSRTGHYEGAHIFSSLSLTSLVFAVACATGGMSSFAAVWLVVVPLEAALSASRRVVAIAAAFALGAAVLLMALTGLDVIPAAGEAHPALMGASIVSAALYATGLALGAGSLTRASLEMLQAEEDRYRLLARNMTDVITRHDRNGAVLFVSSAAQSLFAARVSELTGHGLFERVHVTDRPAYLTALADASALGTPQSVEFRVRRPRDDSAHGVEFVWVEMRCRPLDDAHGEASQGREVVAVIRDISERKAQEMALEEAHAEAERANAAKTRFLATMSHELRTPLNAIIGFSEMLMKEDAMRIEPERRQEYARLINDSGTHLLEVVNGILDMSKLEAGDFKVLPEKFDPAAAIMNACDLLALKANEAGIEIVVRNADNLPDVNADRRAFKQIMLNLLSNAIKFSHRGGRIIVSARAHNAQLQVSVEDNGVGIADSDLPRIGHPFFQAGSDYDRRHDGTGLGLSIVKGLLSLHGGDMRLRSELGKGTTISISLPLDGHGRNAAHATAPTSIAKRNVAAVPLEFVRKQNEIAVRKSA